MGDLRLRDDAPVSEPVVLFASFGEASNAAAVRLEPGDDARALLPFLGQLKLVEVNYPAFTDGRGHSAARILREAGYQGELRATGDVLVDQLPALRRCGFDSFAPQEAMDPADAEAALSRWADVYQATADGRVPIWAKRHG
jgi:uncharacterized protein (DUF934 family)